MALLETPAKSARSGSLLEILLVFLRLGCTSFGGPVAHIGYFREAFVVRRRWADEGTFADVVALSQFLPGPSSSQVAFAIGLSRGGLLGGLAAWCGFALPSAIILFGLAQIAASLTGPVETAVIHGLGLVAVAVVAQAVWGMARMLTPDARRAAIAIAAMIIVLSVAGSFGQIAAILLGAIAGATVCRNVPVLPKGHIAFSVSRSVSNICLTLFFGILFVMPIIASQLNSHPLEVFEAFYRSGALVFGGGHVVLPLLRDAVVSPGWISTTTFLTGYGLAQAIPGPLFTVSAYLGSVLKSPPNGLAGAAVALIGIFSPGMLVLTGSLPYWDRFRTRTGAQAIMHGVNAAVVGILAAALYDPLWKTSIAGWQDVAVAVTGFILLTFAKFPPLLVVLIILAAHTALVISR